MSDPRNHLTPEQRKRLDELAEDLAIDRSVSLEVGGLGR